MDYLEAMEYFESNHRLHSSESHLLLILKHEIQREQRLAYNGIEESGFSNVWEANNAGSEAHANLGRRRKASPNHHNTVEMRGSGE